MNRIFPSSLAAFALVLAAGAAFAVEPPKKKAPELAPFEVVQPFPNVWYGRFGDTSCSWIDTGDGVFVVDTGGSVADAKNLKSEIARTTKNKPVKWIALTHLHQDSNNGFLSFIGPNATVFVNGRATDLVGKTMHGMKSKAPAMVGVLDRIAFVAGKEGFEIGIPSGNAHTAFDLYVFEFTTRTAYVGDLVTTDRCPMLSDPDSDIKGWLEALERIDALKPAVLVATRLNPSTTPASDIEKTRRYLTSMLTFLVEKKKQNAPEARVSGELAGEKLGDYCPRELNAINALSVYRRLLTDGTTRPGSAAAKPAPK